jgi:hypothetical protein
MWLVCTDQSLALRWDRWLKRVAERLIAIMEADLAAEVSRGDVHLSKVNTSATFDGDTCHSQLSSEHGN